MKPTSRSALANVAEVLANALAPFEKGREGAKQTVALAHEFFAFYDALKSSDQLQQLLTEPTTPTDTKLETVDRLLGNKANPIVIEVLKAMVLEKWGDGDDFTAAVEQIGRETLLTAATKDGQLEDVEKQIYELVRGLTDYPDAVGFLSDPATGSARRAEMVRNLLSNSANPITELLAERAAVGSGPYVEKLLNIGDLIAKRRSLTIAKVTSAVELTPEQTQRLERVLSNKYGKPIEVVTDIDPEVIGGLRIAIGPYVIDDTVVSRLSDARRALANRPSG